MPHHIRLQIDAAIFRKTLKQVGNKVAGERLLVSVLQIISNDYNLQDQFALSVYGIKIHSIEV